MGGLSIGYMAFGGCALAWHAAFGGLAVAKHLALGGLAVGLHANDAAARSFFDRSSFFQSGQFLTSNRWIGICFWLVLASCLWPLLIRKGGRARNS